MLKRYDPLGIFLFCFLFLLAFRTQALFYPPYWDSIMGPFHEALWLSENQFDFAKLATMAGYKEGGPNIYFFSIYPAFQAFLMLFFQKAPNMIFFNHIINIMLSCGIVYIVYGIVEKFYGKSTGIFCCLGMFFHPLFLAQSYTINMEIPTLFFGLLGIANFLNQKHAKAVFFLLLSFYCKESGLLFCLAILPLLCFCRGKSIKKIYFLGYFLPVFLFFVQSLIKKYAFPHYGGDSDLKSIPLLFSWPQGKDLILAFLLFPLLSYCLFLWKKRKTSSFSFYGFVFFAGMVLAFMMASLKGISFLLWEIIDIYIFIAVACALGSGILLRSYCLSSQGEKDFCADNILICLSLCFCFFFLISAYMIHNLLPRYFLLILPFVFILIAWCTRNIKAYKQYCLLFLVLFFYANNMYGKVYEFLYGKNAVYQYNGAMLEATLKYEVDIEANLLLARTIEEKYPWAIFVVSYPTIHILSSPKLGYIKKEQKLVSHDRFFFSWRFVLNLSDIGLLDKEAQRRLLWISNKNHCLVRPFAPEKGDRLLETIVQGDREIQIIQRSWKNYSYEK